MPVSRPNHTAMDSKPRVPFGGEDAPGAFHFVMDGVPRITSKFYVGLNWTKTAARRIHRSTDFHSRGCSTGRFLFRARHTRCNPRAGHLSRVFDRSEDFRRLSAR